MSNSPPILQDFIGHLKEEGFSAFTQRGYENDLRHFIRKFEERNGESFSVEGVTPLDILEDRAYLQDEKGLKANSVNRKLSSLSAFFRWAVESGLIQVNPARNIKAVRQDQSAPRWLDKREQFSLLRTIEKDVQLALLNYPKRWRTRQRDASIVLTLLNTGIRLNELCALKLMDIQLSERKGKLLIRHGKGNKEREIPLNAQARIALKKWLDVRPESENQYIWIAVEAKNSKGLSNRAVQRILARYGRKAQIEKFTPHICRHTFAKNLVNQGVSLEKIAMLLGHSNLNTTRIYITPSQHDLELAVEKLEI
ncbi:MAG: hypothetical protein DRI32_05555 [Chloroflexi bacterium]|nr:MAG: hypothetical protein DRI32_05555 [Chloroflexota bacterium]